MSDDNDSSLLPTYKDQVRTCPAPPPKHTNTDDANADEDGTGRTSNEAEPDAYSDPVAIPLADDVRLLGSESSLARFNLGRRGTGTDTDGSTWHIKLNKTKTLWCLSLVLVAAAVFVGTFCGIGSCTASEDADITRKSPTETDISSPNESSASPTSAPTPFIVSETTTSPTSLLDDVADYIQSISLLEGDGQIEYPFPLNTERELTPEERALQWLIEDDPAQLQLPTAGPDDGGAPEFSRLAQRYALLTIWFQQRPDEHGPWLDATNWLATDNECDWYGVTCDDNGYVVMIDLDPPDGDGNNVHGTLSPELGLLTHLKHFEVDTNALTGTLPSTIGLWTALEHLEIDSNMLIGRLPSQIGFWSNLVEFYAWGNEFTGNIPSSVVNWSGITIAMFNQNQLTGSMPFCRVGIQPADLRADCQEVDCPCCTRCSDLE